MTRLFMTGLEAGHVGVFVSAVGSPTVSSSVKRTGARSLSINHYNEYVRIALGTRPSEIYARFGIYVTKLGRDSAPAIYFRDASGVVNATIGFSSSGTLRLFRSHNTVIASGNPIALNTWYCLEAHLKIDNSDGIAQVKMNGVQEIDYTGDTQSSGDAGITTVQLGGQEKDFCYLYGYFDDIAINDTSGTENNSWIGRGGIYLGEVDGAGEHAEFTPASGNNWENVDEIPPDDDTSYVESDTLGHRDLYTTGGITPTSGTISAVQWLARAKMVDAGIGNLQRLVRHDGVDYAGADNPMSTSYSYLSDIMELAPDDTAWTIAKVNALQVGQKVS